MSRGGDLVVIWCSKLQGFPSRVLCLLLVIAQASGLDYYLVSHLSDKHLGWAAGDLLVLTLVFWSVQLYSRVESNSGGDESNDNNNNDDGGSGSANNNSSSSRSRSRGDRMAWVSWLAMQSLLSAKVIVIFTNFSHELDEDTESFFGPNTLKTTIALGSCIFLLLVMSQHDAPLASDRRRYIEELTGTVVFDLLDTADILEVLLDEKERDELGTGIPEFILLVATINLVIPTIPLVTLSLTGFGEKKIARKLVYLHRLLMVLSVNVPNLVVRMLLWHRFSVGISPFTLKNVILIGLTLDEFYEHKKEKFEEHRREAAHEMSGNGSARMPPLPPQPGAVRGGGGGGGVISVGVGQAAVKPRRKGSVGVLPTGVNPGQGPNNRAAESGLYFDLQSRTGDF